MSYKNNKIHINCCSIEEQNFLIKMFDKNGDCLFSSYSDKYGRLSIPINKTGNYRISVCSNCAHNPVKQTRWIRIKNLENYMVYFIFTPNRIKVKHFVLTDRYYENLPIDKGEITLCQNIRLI